MNQDNKQEEKKSTTDYFLDTNKEQLEKDGSEYKTDKAAKQERNYSHGNNFLYNSGQWDKND